jgi:hypothetical protein
MPFALHSSQGTAAPAWLLCSPYAIIASEPPHRAWKQPDRRQCSPSCVKPDQAVASPQGELMSSSVHLFKYAHAECPPPSIFDPAVTATTSTRAHRRSTASEPVPSAAPLACRRWFPFASVRHRHEASLVSSRPRFPTQIGPPPLLRPRRPPTTSLLVMAGFGRGIADAPWGASSPTSPGTAGPWIGRQWVGPSQTWPKVHIALCYLSSELIDSNSSWFKHS